MTRQRLVIANWKMNGTLQDNAVWAEGFLSRPVPDCEVAVCAPFVYLPQMTDLLRGSAVALGAENVSQYDAGAYTGEVSAEMLGDVGCRWVIVGHSERRTLFSESDECVAEKAKAALAAGLKVVICVGESLKERESDETLRVVERQLSAVIRVVGVKALKDCAVAYEPVWAIGTGKTATPEMAQAVHCALRNLVACHSREVAQELRILYGGSVKPGNAAELFAQADIDGGLIGGAALKSEDFYAICAA